MANETSKSTSLPRLAAAGSGEEQTNIAKDQAQAAAEVDILCVEDSPTQAELLKNLLERCGYRVAVAGNGREALSSIAQQRPRLVVSDVRMPEMDGYSLCHAMKSAEHLRDIPVIILTMLSHTQDIVQALECGADAFVFKPYDGAYLVSRIEACLLGRGQSLSHAAESETQALPGSKSQPGVSSPQQIHGLLISTYEQAVRLNEDLKAKQRQLDVANRTLLALYRVTRILNEAASENGVVEAVLSLPDELPGVKAVWLLEWVGGTEFHLLGARGLPAGFTLEVGAGAPCTCQRALLAGDLNHEVNIIECERLCRAGLQGPSLRNHASVPLKIGDRLLGVMNLCGIDQGTLGDDDLRNVASLGSQVAIALERVRSHQQLERQMAERTQELRTEIVQRRLGEDALRESDERYRDLFESAGDLIQIAAMDGRLLYVNRAWREALGYQEAEVRRLQVMDVVHPRCRETYQQTLEALRAGQKIGHIEVVFVSRDHREIPLEGSINCRFVGGHAVSIRGILRDVSGRKQAEEQIRELARLVDLSHDAILVCDLETRLRFYNRGAEWLYGWTAPEVTGRNLLDFLFPDPARVKAAIEKMIDAGEWNGELTHLTKLGKSVVVDSRWTLLRNAEGQPQSVLMINKDITEEKKLQAQFLHAQRMESVGRLASGIAHDLNNALAPIVMSLPVLRWDLPADEREETLSTIESSAARAVNIIKQVLTIGRGMEGERIPMNLRPLLREVVNIASNTFPKSIRVESSAPQLPWPVIGDPTQIHQVLLNLCVNARDAMPQGGSLFLGLENRLFDESAASTLAEARPGPYVLLTVRDTGQGIPPEIMDKIFDPFFTTKDAGKGTGLGLSTVLAIVKNHGGFVTASSQPNQGATFQVFLPATPEADVTELPRTTKALPSSDGDVVLVVDDERQILETTKRVLERHGYRVLLAKDGTEALSLAVAHAQELKGAVVDLMMPRLDGAHLIRALRRLAPDLPVIPSSAVAVAQGQGGLAELSALEVEPQLIKPYTAEALLEAVYKALHSRS